MTRRSRSSSPTSFIRPPSAAASTASSAGLRRGLRQRADLPAAEGLRGERQRGEAISEEAIGQAEHTSLFLEAAGKATFVGGRAEGVNGEGTDVVLPGVSSQPLK
jgi:hypothetical protein